LKQAIENSVSLHDIGQKIARRGMAAPAIFFLELYKPLSTLVYSAALFSQPLLGAIFGRELIEQAKELLKSRQNIEALIVELENLGRQKEPSLEL